MYTLYDGKGAANRWKRRRPDLRGAIQQRIESMWATLDGRLADNRPYLLGDTFSGADLMLTM